MLPNDDLFLIFHIYKKKLVKVPKLANAKLAKAL
jgi:hypothetical protein